MSPRARRVAALPLAVLCLVAMTAGEPRAGLLSGVLSTLSQLVNGTVGAVLSRGSWTLQIPAGAFDGAATVTMASSLNDPSVCELGISPADKNGFANPATLMAKVPAGISLSTAHIEWYNPQTQTWDPVPGSTVNPLTRTVSARIWHFSTYRVGGRNGW